MPLTIDWGSRTIYVPKSYLSQVGATLYELDLQAFRLDLLDAEDGEDGIAFPRTHEHFTQVTVGGVTLARVIEIINGYTVTFEDGMYAVNAVGANSNLGDVINRNSVSVLTSNSAGLVVAPSSSGDWSSAEREQIRYRLGLDGPSAQPVAEPDLAIRGDVEDIPAQVWSAGSRTLTQDVGLSAQQATMLLEIYRILGLDPTVPLVVTPTSRRVPASGDVVDQSIEETGTTITVRRLV